MLLRHAGRLSLIAILSLGVVCPAFAAVIYDEASGDLPGSGLSPTIQSLGVLSEGSNEVHGTTGGTVVGGTRIPDRDYFTVTVPVGFKLTALTQLPGTTSLVGFLGVQTGAQLTVAPSAATAAGLLGWIHYGIPTLGTDLLPTMGTNGFGADGFTPPLGAGDYSFWIQDTTEGTFAYRFDLVVEAVPVPASFGMVLLGVGAMALARRWRRARD
jgi:hypothetical protein